MPHAPAPSMAFKPVRWLLPIVIIILGVYLAHSILATPPPPAKHSSEPPPQQVEGFYAIPTSHQVQLHSYGSVKARTESSLSPEVSGRITKISPQFNDGGYFRKGEELVRLDSQDYTNEVTVAEATLQKARAALSLEKARSEQAKANWESLPSRQGKPGDLVLHLPQLAEARAVVSSTKALLERAERNLRRTKIYAPYDGRISEKLVDIGQYVSPGNVLAKIYATDFAEVLLPLSDRQIKFLGLIENASRQNTLRASPIQVTITANGLSWKGTIVRSRGIIDPKSRLHHIIAQIHDPYSYQDQTKPPLKIGAFVTAVIDGKVLNDVFVIPRNAIDNRGSLVIVGKNGNLRKIQSEAIWRDKNNIIIKTGISSGNIICLRPWPVKLENAKYTLKLLPTPTSPSTRPNG